MKYLKERQLAKEALKAKLGFAPKLENIVALESDHVFGECTYVLFGVKGSKIIYRANKDQFGINLVMETREKEVNL